MWDVEEIPCKTAAELMQDWSALEHLKRSGGSKRKQKQRDPRIHVLKIDAEGHDFQVRLFIMSSSVWLISLLNLPYLLQLFLTYYI